MSLWTPYDPEQVLDLSKAAAAVKTEIGSPPRHSPPEATAPLLYSHHVPRYQPYETSPRPLQQSPSMYDACSPPASSPDSGSDPSCRRPPRPFKAVTAALPACGAAAAAEPDPSYAAFRAAMLEAMRARNGGTLTVSNPRMRRAVRRNSDVGDDADYLQRRARNNAAAKRSRDLRKQKEDELAIRVAFLERHNAELREELAAATVGSRCPRCLTGYPAY